MKTTTKDYLMTFVVVGLLAFGAVRPVAAQDVARGSVSGGYQFADIFSSDASEAIPAGWYVDVAGDMTRSFALVAAAGGNYKTVQESATVGGVTAGARATIKFHELMGGTRVSRRASSNVVPFGQFLVGAVVTSASFSGTTVMGGQTVYSSSAGDSQTHFGLRGGGGVTVAFTRSIGIRLQADYMRIFAAAGDANIFRFGAGVSIPF